MEGWGGCLLRSRGVNRNVGKDQVWQMARLEGRVLEVMIQLSPRRVSRLARLRPWGWVLDPLCVSFSKLLNLSDLLCHTKNGNHNSTCLVGYCKK